MGRIIKIVSPIVLSVLIVLNVVMFSLFTIKETEEREGGILIESSLPLGKYEEPFTVTVGQMVSATKYIDGESASDNVMYDLCEEVMNVKFKSLFSANVGDAYNYQLNTFMLSGDVPDLFFCSQNQLNDLIEQGMVQDLTEAYEKYASPGLRLAMEYNYTGDISVWNDGNPNLIHDTALLDACSVDGKLYGLPFLADLFENCPLMWIRADWLKAYLDSKGVVIGEDETINDYLPKNFSEYLDIVYYFTNNDPDGNGQKDTYGFSVGFEAANLQGIANIYGGYPGYYLKDENGEFYYGTNMDGTYEAMKLMNQLYNDKCVDQNSAFDGQSLKTALASGKIGTFLGEYWSVMTYGLGDAYLVNQDIDWLPWAIRDYDGNIIKPLVPYNISNNSFYCMSKQALNPEVIIILANHLVDRFFSDDGEFTQKVVEIRKSEKYASVASELEMYLPFRLDAPNKNIRYAFDLQKAFATNDTSFLTLDESTYYNNIKAFLDSPRGEGKTFYPYYKIFCENGAYSELANYATYDYETDKNMLKVNFIRPAYYQINTKEMAKFKSIVTDYEAQELIFLYAQPMAISDGDWSYFCNGLNGKGITEILRGLNT